MKAQGHSSLVLLVSAIFLAGALTYLLVGESSGIAEAARAGTDSGERGQVEAVLRTGSDKGSERLEASGAVERAFPRETTGGEVAAGFLLSGVCVDSGGEPIADVRVVLRTLDGARTASNEGAQGRARARRSITGSDRTYSDRTYKGEGDQVQVHTTDRGGRFRFEVRRPRSTSFSLVLAFETQGFVPCERVLALSSSRESLDLGQVVLPRGVRLGGSLSDWDGNPVAGAELWALNWNYREADLRTPRRVWATTDPLGQFDLGWCLPGAYHLELPDHALASEDEVVLTLEHPLHRLELALAVPQKLNAIGGVVRDGEGNAIPGAKLYAIDEDREQWRTQSDEQGRFRLARKKASRETVQLSALAQGYDLAVLEEPTAWGEEDIEVSLPPAPVLEIVVKDREGAPVEEFGLRIRRLGAHPLAPLEPSSVFRDQGRHEGGRLRIVNLIGGSYWVRVEPKAREDLQGSPFLPAVLGASAAPGEVFRLDVVLPTAVDRWLRLVSEGGRGIAGCRVELLLARPAEGLDADTFAGVPFGTTARLAREDLLLWTGRTDKEGRVLLRGPGEMPLVIALGGPGCVPRDVKVPGLEGEGELVLVVDVPARIAVRVQEPRILADLVRVLPRPPVLRFLPRGSDLRGKGEEFPLESPAPSEGQVLELEAGPRVALLDLAGEKLVLGELEVERGRTVPLAVDLEPFAPVVLEATVRQGGDPLPLADVSAKRFGEVLGPQRAYWKPVPLRTDAAGGLRVEGLPGRYRLTLPSRRKGGGELLLSPGEVTLRPGQHLTQDFSLELGELRLRLVDRAGQPMAGVEGIELLRETDRSFAARLGSTDEEGWSDWVECEVGTFVVRVLPRRLSSHRAQVELLMSARDPNALEDLRIFLGMVSTVRDDRTQATFELPLAYDE